MPVEIIFHVNYVKIMGFLVYSPRGGGGQYPRAFDKTSHFGGLYTRGGGYTPGGYTPMFTVFKFWSISFSMKTVCGILVAFRYFFVTG